MTSYWLGASGAALLVAATAWAGTPAQRSTPPAPKADGGPTLKEARKFLEGRWSLESFEVRQPGKAPIVLKGEGVLTYDDFGNLRMEIRTDQDAADLLRAAGIEIHDGKISTDGRTAIDLQNHTLTYFLQGQPAAGGGPLAANRPRHWEVSGDLLTLTTRDASGAPLSIGRWRKRP